MRSSVSILLLLVAPCGVGNVAAQKRDMDRSEGIGTHERQIKGIIEKRRLETIERENRERAARGLPQRDQRPREIATEPVIDVSTDAEFRAALDAAGPGSTILLAPGVYTGGIALRNKNGEPGKPIVIAAKDPVKRPVFEGGGGQAMHLADCNHVTLRGLHIRGFPTNGINIDDGGTFETPSTHIVVEDVLFERIGPTGNVDALKMSGVDEFAVRTSTFRGWGGSAIDMVGCHWGLVESCSFSALPGHDQTSGVQMKGGTADVRVLRSTFTDAAQRAINLGGSTGLQFFRPNVQGYEAARIEIAGNRFLGGEAPIAIVTAQDAHIHNNTIVRPGRWVLRILQETESPDFAPCSGGLFEHNLVVFDANLKTTVNVGSGTAPETFTFRHNAWFGEGVPSTPTLPVAEIDGLVGVDPALTKNLEVSSEDPRLARVGADSYPSSTTARIPETPRESPRR